MAKIEKEILGQSDIKPLVWKRFVDDVFSLWSTSADKIEEFIQKANNFHLTIKFTAEILEEELTFLDTKGYKGARFHKESILDMQTYYKPLLIIFNTRIFTRVTHQASQKVLSREKH